MPLNLASPGILIREVDLTIGKVNSVSNSVGALVGPFAKGPVLESRFIGNENELLNTFGKPYSVDKHYEHWLVASSYLAYGGGIQIVRTDSENLKTAFYGEATTLKIKSLEHYTELGYLDNPLTDVTVMAQNPGSWANGISIAMIDSKADQILSGINTASIKVGYAVTQSISTVSPGIGTTSILNGYLKGLITGIGKSTIDVKLLSHVSNDGTISQVDYQFKGVYNFANNGSIGIHTSNVSTAFTSRIYSEQLDWFDQQTCTVGVLTSKNNTPSKVNWNSLAPRPGTSEFASDRNSRFDEVHVIVIDAEGKITGNAGTILEKHLSLSKASDALYSSGSPSYWRKYLTVASEYIFAGSTPSGITTTGFSVPDSYALSTDNDWDQQAQDITFGCCGALDLPLSGGTNYDGNSDVLAEGSLNVQLGDLIGACDQFLNEDQIDIDFLLMGSAAYEKTACQAWASKLISVAESRKDCIAFISPYRASSITDTSSQTATTVRDVDTITDNIVSFYSPIPSSTYSVFDSGYKYMYDRFNNTFRYVPLNGDIAGICARNDINNFPWYSPGGTSRGTILNAAKLAYNPGKKQKDTLYTNRINPVAVSPGAGIILFGDKTGYGKSSAFDRINVRRLFIYLENAISEAAKDQLFEFNDEITRTNFVNIVEPFLRDIQSKRGIYDYVVICDETNNTASIIDSNEFVADIYIKPAKTINFIGLTFIATRTGVAFEEVIGNF